MCYSRDMRQIKGQDAGSEPPRAPVRENGPPTQQQCCTDSYYSRFPLLLQEAVFRSLCLTYAVWDSRVSRAAFVCLTGNPPEEDTLLPPRAVPLRKQGGRSVPPEWACFYAGLQTDVPDHDPGQRGGHRPSDRGPAQVRGAVYLLLRSGTGTRAAVTRKTSAGIRRWFHFFSRSTEPYRVDPPELDCLFRCNFRAVLVKSDGHRPGPL